MIRPARLCRFGVLMSGWLVGGLLLGGCGLASLVAPPPEAVLAGTWELQEPAIGVDVFYEFDALGRLTEVRYELGSVAVRVNSFRLSRVELDGSAVSIEFSAPLASLELAGTLNESQDRIEGVVTTHLELGLIQVDIDNGSALLVRQ